MGRVFVQEETGVPVENLRCLGRIKLETLFSHACDQGGIRTTNTPLSGSVRTACFRLFDKSWTSC